MYYDRNVSQIIRLWEEILAETIIDSYLVEEKLWVVEEIRLTPLVWWPFQWSSWRSESIPERGIDTYKAAILIWKIDKKFTEWYLRERNQEDIPQTKWEDSIKWCGRIARKPNCLNFDVTGAILYQVIQVNRVTCYKGITDKFVACFGITHRLVCCAEDCISHSKFYSFV